MSDTWNYVNDDWKIDSDGWNATSNTLNGVIDGRNVVSDGWNVVSDSLNVVSDGLNVVSDGWNAVGDSCQYVTVALTMTVNDSLNISLLHFRQATSALTCHSHQCHTRSPRMSFTCLMPHWRHHQPMRRLRWSLVWRRHNARMMRVTPTQRRNAR